LVYLIDPILNTALTSEQENAGTCIEQVSVHNSTSKVFAVHVDKEDKTTTLIQVSGSNYKANTLMVNESGLYSLVLSSKLPQAKAFKRWVTAEVLPQIRKTGG